MCGDATPTPDPLDEGIHDCPLCVAGRDHEFGALCNISAPEPSDDEDDPIVCSGCHEELSHEGEVHDVIGRHEDPAEFCGTGVRLTPELRAAMAEDSDKCSVCGADAAECLKNYEMNGVHLRQPHNLAE
jgi:hypothetical protein